MTLLDLLAAPNTKTVHISGKEFTLRKASAHDAISARAEAERLTAEHPEDASRVSNCCLLARCLRRPDGTSPTADELLRSFSCSDIEQLTREYLELGAAAPTVFDSEEEIQRLMRQMALASYERMKWRVLREFRVLPNEARARSMTDSDYLYCFINMRLDDEEALRALCPDCRERLETQVCPSCGTPLTGQFTNPSFDIDRFNSLKEGERLD